MPPILCISPGDADHHTTVARAYHARKSHTKSRNGCDHCKRRKKKCDQMKPICSGCSKLGLNCHYVESTGSSEVSRSASPHAPGSIITFHGLTGLRPGEVELLQHFHLHTIGTLGSPSVQEAVSGCLAAAVDLGFLRHTIFALSKSHLMVLSERNDFAMNYHFDKALSTFRNRLSSPVEAAHVDAVITTCVLLNTIAFAKDPQTSSESWLITDEGDLQWLTLHIGLRRIMFDIGQKLKESSWRMVYAKEATQFWGKARTPFGNSRSECEEIPKDLQDFFRTGYRSRKYNTSYQSTLQSLVPLLALEPSTISLTQLMAIAHRWDQSFYQSVQAKDLHALLLLSYWLGLLCEVNVWWVSSRAVSECFACCEYLDARGDHSTRELLGFPAQRCNYLLKNVYTNTMESSMLSLGD